MPSMQRLAEVLQQLLVKAQEMKTLAWCLPAQESTKRWILCPEESILRRNNNRKGRAFSKADETFATQSVDLGPVVNFAIYAS